MNIPSPLNQLVGTTIGLSTADGRSGVAYRLLRVVQNIDEVFFLCAKWTGFVRDYGISIGYKAHCSNTVCCLGDVLHDVCISVIAT